MIHVVVVDDSAFMRKAISTMLEKDPDIKVVGTGRDGEEGLELVRRLNPDVVTLDIEMPRMDGLTALRHIMMEMPRPVLMVSSLTAEGAEATLKAMELGAVDFIPKQLSKVSLDIVKIEDDLRAKVKLIAKRKVRSPSSARSLTAQAAALARQTVSERPAARRPLQKSSGPQLHDLVAIGVSTGGPPAVQKVLSRLPKDFPAGIVIAQHMPAAFTGPFAKRLDGVCAITVKEAEHGERLVPGVAYISPGGRHLRIEQKVSRIDISVTDEPKEALYKPSANVMIESVAQGVGRRGLGVILTGMGSDGMEGVRALKGRGGRALAQSDATCVVYGMPKAVVDAGLADEIVDIDDMGEAIITNLYK
ncbi:protein-glutamate methylesterase/protein-glutamine glutaminase [Desulfolutivibrio sulfoxidireducens]|uniref:protein-glutamate methylesterase/protein-glutamine glutaminase n=1 Tax=Desulfolutivibrio sulfoxidireducens TaxID=2773299 RepID=UPI00159E0B3F|nr:chemotaxis response regulator protein-glutamate methylesterase [Desulfolutivibrio sulfoxidireducens]QLA16805.1 chemotaxis-specific protein-glutamate methyltransferase CheB [Desulfolutivibrio sulfoxidireducens]QLA20370.1 chemotaxis-specific protein-glutamate methyltransferase CheB [Desulfolutivibrio sulfoxidireducens]